MYHYRIEHISYYILVNVESEYFVWSRLVLERGSAPGAFDVTQLDTRCQ